MPLKSYVSTSTYTKHTSNTRKDNTINGQKFWNKEKAMNHPHEHDDRDHGTSLMKTRVKLRYKLTHPFYFSQNFQEVYIFLSEI